MINRVTSQVDLGAGNLITGKANLPGVDGKSFLEVKEKPAGWLPSVSTPMKACGEPLFFGWAEFRRRRHRTGYEQMQGSGLYSSPNEGILPVQFLQSFQ